MKNFERQYADSLHNLLKFGKRKNNRTGITTLSIQHQYFYVHQPALDFPILKGKKVYPKLALKEMMWMLNGKDNVKWLKDRGVNYWDNWADEKGSIGKSYGYQFRRWVDNSKYKGTDQTTLLIQEMLNNPDSRRLIINLWNVQDLEEMRLPPCVYNYQFAINKLRINTYEIDLHVLSRSEDSFLGMPYDIMGASWLLKIFTTYLSMETGNNYVCGNIHYTANDYHIYENHISQAYEYLSNITKNKDGIIDGIANIKIEIPEDYKLENKELNERFDKTLKFWDERNYCDFKIEKNYKEVYGKIEAKVAV